MQGKRKTGDDTAEREQTMKIIIAGLGEAGIALVRALAKSSHEITVIDRDSTIVDSITDRYSVNCVSGSGAAKETLIKAGVEGADFFIALTHIDEVNLLSCMQAKNLGAGRTVARLQMPDLSSDLGGLQKEYGIDYILRPGEDIAEEMYRNLGLPGFVKLEGIFGDTVTLLDMNVQRDSCLAGRSLAEIRGNIRKDILISAVIRDEKLYIPDGRFVIEVGDILTISVAVDTLDEVMETLGIRRDPAKRILMVGCNLSGEILAEKLLSEGREITILESDIRRCRELSDKFPKVNVLCSKGEITDILEEEGLNGTGTLIALTGSDETNLVVSLFAWSKKVPSVIALVDKQSHVRLLHKVMIDITASPTELSVMKIMHLIRNTEAKRTREEVGRFYGFHRVADGMADVMEFAVGNELPVLNVPFAAKEFSLKKGILISGIIRDDRLIIPGGSSSLQAGDRVLLTVPVANGINTLADAFK